ncbi:hypothetical protein BC829DRAFT_418785 [Chytridium lagenaria]|nr:hypothetical protein BC829DRAFT_418785 [Chytridium lagenaria]
MEWQPQTNYVQGSKVIYQGVTYQIVQPHTSQVGWEPPMTPALWNRVAGETHQQTHQHDSQCGHQEQQHQQQEQKPSYEVRPSDPAPSYENRPEEKKEEQYQNQEQQQDQQQEHKKPGFFENPYVQVAAGVLGASALAGVGGLAAYKFHKNQSDDQKRDAWVNEVTIVSQNDQRENKPLFWITPRATRVYHDSGVCVGKANPKMGCNIGYGNKEISIKDDKFQVLCGNVNAIKWVEVSGACSTSSLQNALPIAAGQEKDGRILFLAQTFYNNSVQIGKAGEHINDGMVFPYGGKEVTSRTYKVACYA